MLKDAKYMFAYLLPLIAWAGLHFGGILAPGAFWIGFIFLPLLELFVPAAPVNLSKTEEDSRSSNSFFELLLYLNLPILYFLLYCFIQRLVSTSFTTLEYIGFLLNMGVVLGTLGINVAHELGHRHDTLSRSIARLLLIPALYGHFTIEHNWGHHVRVGTPEDPATARKGESIYSFWWRSVTGSYLHAWKLEHHRLAKKGRTWLSPHNELIWMTLIQILYLCVLYFLGGVFLVLSGMVIALLGILLLESVNYIEHYGILRNRTVEGQYEKQSARHSWNSNHELGRIFLYELTRHADHHLKPTRKYQVLRHLDESPQLPYGYPGSIVLALLPPVWFAIMNPKVPVSSAA